MIGLFSAVVALSEGVESSTQGGTKLLIDHTFALNDSVKMEYVPALVNGFDHNGMLITIDT